MIKIYMDARELQALRGRYAQLGKRFRRDILAKEVKRASRLGLIIAREEVPVKSGALARSLRVADLGETSFLIEEGENYGKYVRSGVKPHPIFPRVKKALWWKGLPHPIAWVRIWPGTKPNPYHIRTARRFKKEVVPILAKGLADAIWRYTTKGV